jgi:alpha-D-ribose 1-methylphosphonate 5-triphosphate synthase subunit PhnG
MAPSYCGLMNDYLGDKFQRTQLLVKSGAEFSKKLADQVRKSVEVKILEHGKPGLVMVKMRENARNSQFYLAEVLVSRARAYIGDSSGLGIVQGQDLDWAEDLAVIDAAVNSNCEIVKEWAADFKQAEELISLKNQKNQSRINSTKVDFQSMQKEEYMG